MSIQDTTSNINITVSSASNNVVTSSPDDIVFQNAMTMASNNGMGSPVAGTTGGLLFDGKPVATGLRSETDVTNGYRFLNVTNPNGTSSAIDVAQLLKDFNYNPRVANTFNTGTTPTGNNDSKGINISINGNNITIGQSDSKTSLSQPTSNYMSSPYNLTASPTLPSITIGNGNTQPGTGYSNTWTSNSFLGNFSGGNYFNSSQPSSSWNIGTGANGINLTPVSSNSLSPSYNFFNPTSSPSITISTGGNQPGTGIFNNWQSNNSLFGPSNGGSYFTSSPVTPSNSLNITMQPKGLGSNAGKGLNISVGQDGSINISSDKSNALRRPGVYNTNPFFGPSTSRPISYMVPGTMSNMNMGSKLSNIENMFGSPSQSSGGGSGLNISFDNNGGVKLTPTSGANAYRNGVDPFFASPFATQTPYSSIPLNNSVGSGYGTNTGGPNINIYAGGSGMNMPEMPTVTTPTVTTPITTMPVVTKPVTPSPLITALSNSYNSAVAGDTTKYNGLNLASGEIHRSNNSAYYDVHTKDADGKTSVVAIGLDMFRNLGFTPKPSSLSGVAPGTGNTVPAVTSPASAVVAPVMAMTMPGMNMSPALPINEALPHGHA